MDNNPIIVFLIWMMVLIVAVVAMMVIFAISGILLEKLFTHFSSSREENPTGKKNIDQSEDITKDTDEQNIISKEGTNNHRDHLNPEQIEYRKGIVAKSKLLSGEGKNLKEIAKELGMSERTLRDWRHNPRFE